MKEMKNMKLLVAASLAVVLMATGCSSVMCGKTQTVTVKSQPHGADVVVYDRFDEVIFRGVTPCRVTLDRCNEDKTAGQYRISLSKDGFTPEDVRLAGKVNRAYFANVLFLNVPGLAVVDPLTGAMWTLTPMEIDKELLARSDAP